MPRRLELGGVLGGVVPALLLAAEVEAKAEPVKAEAAEGVVLGAAACTGTAAAVPAVAAGACLLVALGVVDLVVGGVDLVHLPGGLRVVGVEVGVVFLRQGAVCFFDFVRAGIG